MDGADRRVATTRLMRYAMNRLEVNESCIKRAHDDPPGVRRLFENEIEAWKEIVHRIELYDDLVSALTRYRRLKIDHIPECNAQDTQKFSCVCGLLSAWHDGDAVLQMAEEGPRSDG